MMFGLKDGSIRIMVDHGLESMVEYVQVDLLPKMTQKTIMIAISVAGLVAIILIILVATVLFIKDMEEYKAGLKKSEFYPAVHKITQKLSDTGIAYMKTQMIIMTIIAGVNALGFFILKNPYALLIGIIVGVFDAFPVLGSGLILVPWSISMVLQKKFMAAAIIMTVFTVCQIIREILEPRLLGNKIGIRPIYNMMAMYVGLQLFGVTGFFLGPLSLVIIRTVVNETTNDKNKEGPPA
jgi:sporulation integral membrane protein YtvI